VRRAVAEQHQATPRSGGQAFLRQWKRVRPGRGWLDPLSRWRASGFLQKSGCDHVRVIVAFRANRILTGQMTGQLNAAEADRIDERRRRLRPDDTALAQQANAPSGRLLLEYARGAIPPRVLGSPRNHRRHGAGLLGAVPQCAIGSREIVGGAGSGRHTFPPFSLSSRVEAPQN